MCIRDSILTVVRNELTMALAEDTPAEDLDRAARAVVAALHSEEFDLAFNGVRYRAQRSEKLRIEADGRLRVRVHYCRMDDWGRVMYEEWFANSRV